jgi:AcrR family transcriptional regulator
MSDTPDIRGRILDAAIEMIESGGEASIRVTQIAEKVGVTQPALYHHFKDRAALVTAAYVRWFERHLLLDIPPSETIKTVVTREDYVQRFRETIAWGVTPGREYSRSVRVAVLGAAQTNPDLRAEINKINHALFESIANNIRVGQENGWARADLDPLATAYWLNGQVTGRFIAEMNGGQLDLNLWDDVSEKAVLSLLGLD